MAIKGYSDYYIRKSLSFYIQEKNLCTKTTTWYVRQKFHSYTVKDQGIKFINIHNTHYAHQIKQQQIPQLFLKVTFVAHLNLIIHTIQKRTIRKYPAYDVQLKLCFKCNAPQRFSEHSMTKLIFSLLHACFQYSFPLANYQLIITFLPRANSVMPFPRCNKGAEGNCLWEQHPDNPNTTL